MLIWAESGTTFYSQDLPDAKPASQPARASQSQPARPDSQAKPSQPSSSQTPSPAPSSSLLLPALLLLYI